MKRMIFVPQLPVKMRYSEFWITKFETSFKKYFDVVIVLGKNFLKNNKNQIIADSTLFSSTKNSIIFENKQIEEFLDLEITNEDYIFLADTSFPGGFSNILYHKPIKNAFSYCHATSLNRYDYFESVRKSKYQCEVAHSKLFKKVFVGSEYHKRKLGWNNIEVAGLPVPQFKTFKEEKNYEIISVARPNNQKITKYIEKNIEREFCKIERSTFYTWEQYYKFLSAANILIITSKEDTFNYSVMEAIMNGTVVLAPNRCAFPELLKPEYLYNNWDDLRYKIWYYLEHNKPQEKLLNQELCDKFYENIIKIMKED